MIAGFRIDDRLGRYENLLAAAPAHAATLAAVRALVADLHPTGTGKALRHIKLTGPEAAGAPAVRAPMRVAMAERALSLGLERGGRTE